MKFSEGIARANRALAADAQDARAADEVCRIRLQGIADQIDVEGYAYELSKAGGHHISVWKVGSAYRFQVWYSEEHGYSYRRAFGNAHQLRRTHDLSEVIEHLCYEIEKLGVATVSGPVGRMG